MLFYDKRLILRINESQYEKILKAVAKNPDIYESTSHFIRCAINKELKK